ncbi:MAG: hypothetical protein ACREDH_11475 [Methylocella sp.]
MARFAKPAVSRTQATPAPVRRKLAAAFAKLVLMLTSGIVTV